MPDDATFVLGALTLTLDAVAVVALRPDEARSPPEPPLRVLTDGGVLVRTTFVPPERDPAPAVDLTLVLEPALGTDTLEPAFTPDDLLALNDESVVAPAFLPCPRLPQLCQP